MSGGDSSDLGGSAIDDSGFQGRPVACLCRLLVLPALLAIGCVAPPSPPSVPLPLSPAWWVPALPLTHEPLSALLGLLAARPASRQWTAAEDETLGGYLATLSRGGPLSNPELFPSPDYVLAYLINAHIAWTLALGHAPELTDLEVAGLSQASITVGGVPSTLQRLVGEIWLRAPLEPRLRLFLNPGWRGGPALPINAIEGHAIDWQLAAQAERCGHTPGFWVLDPRARELRVSAFTALMWGLPDAPQLRARRLLDAVPPPTGLREAILASCGAGLQRCSIVLTPFNQGRMWAPPTKKTLRAQAANR